MNKEQEDFIYAYWAQQYKQHGAAYEASWGDLNMINLEIAAIGNYLPLNKKLKILDVGCGNGFSMYAQYLRSNDRNEYHGIDIVPAAIDACRKRFGNAFININERFQVADCRELPWPDNTFDYVYTTRTLINLPTWLDQKKAISECRRVTKPDGIMLFSEAFWEPLNALNALRLSAGYEPLVVHDFNNYLNLAKTKTFLDSYKLSPGFVKFSELYYLGTRFIRPFLGQHRDDVHPNYSDPFNKEFYKLQVDYGKDVMHAFNHPHVGFGIQQLIKCIVFK